MAPGGPKLILLDQQMLVLEQMALADPGTYDPKKSDPRTILEPPTNSKQVPQRARITACAGTSYEPIAQSIRLPLSPSNVKHLFA